MKNFWIIAGEASGDMYGAELAAELRKLAAENGEQVMFESYALIQPADGLNNQGHIRLASSTATVVRNEDGTINGEKSWMLYCDQGCYTSGYGRKHAQKTPDGDHYFVQGGIDVKVTFVPHLLPVNRGIESSVSHCIFIYGSEP